MVRAKMIYLLYATQILFPNFNLGR